METPELSKIKVLRSGISKNSNIIKEIGGQENLNSIRGLK